MADGAAAGRGFETTYFPFVNLAQMAVDGGDEKRCEYWIGELAGARKRMAESMKEDLAKYLVEAEWSAPVEEQRFWLGGPAKWIAEATRKGVLALLALALLVGLLSTPPASADPLPQGGPDTVGPIRLQAEPQTKADHDQRDPGGHHAGQGIEPETGVSVGEI